MPHAAHVPPRAAFDDDAELAGSLTVLERVAVAERLVLVIDELEKDIDVTRKDSDVLVDAKGNNTVRESSREFGSTRNLLAGE
ncbi:uncharacterized protein ARMOST_21577 [Armillaria ostoyae]|uniref:Uncharacterized protein n=1 Tax=Armillaria ostoyae TaxID=47428 RepID=A0A284SAL2_ARMOS|nr:uncharacterized protein ARMOST_21577 [Armillaria ostoyae]